MTMIASLFFMSLASSSSVAGYPQSCYQINNYPTCVECAQDLYGRGGYQEDAEVLQDQIRQCAAKYRVNDVQPDLENNDDRIFRRRR
jgi:hypothetical protein